ncbi:MAG: PH domain-containing protein [Planctomycetota bacterium]|nr:PH domain-containing protein [Planctomycetota bacterium]MDA1212257.1 PH domain-containing protein [Planctomycetota bacterium]
MVASTVQAISGVSADVENEIQTIYPSIASTGIGRMLGSLYDSIPLKICGIKLSYLLFPLPTHPLPLAVYLGLKVVGPRYILTNRAVQIWNSLGNQMQSQVLISDIADVVTVQQPGQDFYNAADLEFYDASGKRLFTLAGIARPEAFRQAILKTRDARKLVSASLASIQARQPVGA